jgi:hypothetical protein
MVKFYAAANLQEAQILSGMLAHAGIESQIFNQHSQGALGEIPFGETYPEIWLADECDLGLAQKLLNVYEQPVDATQERTCGHCGESNPANFSLCWHCGTSLPVR